MRVISVYSFVCFKIIKYMLKKKQNPDVLKVLKKLPVLLEDIDYRDTNLEGRNFSIIQRRCNLWGWDTNYVSVCISGGCNGCGKWSKYLDTLSQTMKRIESAWEDSFIENIEFDVTDDIFYAQVIIKIR